MEWNGTMVTDPAELPPELRPLLEDANHNGIPDLYEQGVTRPIIINGKLYRSLEEVPEPFRAEVENALAAPRTGVAPEPSVEISRSFNINGQRYASLDQVPAEHRERIREAMSKMIGETPKPPQSEPVPSSREGSRPAQGSPDRVGEGGLSLPEPERGRDGETEREGASVASGCGGEGAGPEVPEGGSERGGGGGWGAEGRSEPSQGSHDRVGEGGLCPPEPERGRVWEPSQGSHNNDMQFPWALTENRPTSTDRARSSVVPWIILAAAAGAGLAYLFMR
jgi:hypothetical protein